jgi:hypothetical protein
MNQGVFGFPAALGGAVLSTTEIDVSGTYLIAPGTKRLVIFAVGGGGGGGAGGKRASGTAQSGGGGGSGGSQIYQDFNVEDLGGANTTLSIVIGAGGVAGATGADTAAGGIGGTGGTTTITPTGKPGTLIRCEGGIGANGGSTSSEIGGAIKTGFSYGATLTHIIGGGCSSVGVAVDVNIISINNHGGAGGAGLAVSPVALGGGQCYFSAITATSYNGSINNARASEIIGNLRGTSTVTTVNPNIHIMGKMSPGIGGNGGGSGTTGGTKGGNGYRGSGGGGGGSTLNTFTAGTGGTGGNGYVCITAIG